jgi:precorrin-2/cobalt-factor-2 C20-methyltransferase
VGLYLFLIICGVGDEGRLFDAIDVDLGTMAGVRVVRISELYDGAVPYFSIILLPGGRGRRIA